MFANAGTPLIWFNLIHLVLINAIIGYVESGILSRFKIAHKVGLVLLANYISMIIGFYIIIPKLTKIFHGGDLYNGSFSELKLGFLISFLATLLIEYPFFLASLNDKKQKNAMLTPFLIANVFTNLAMITFYYLFIANSH